jgi:hypothetical protein
MPRTALHEAVLYNFNPNLLMPRTALHEAVLCDDVFKLNRLLDEGADPNVQVLGKLNNVM